jgi:uncharacterized protein YpmB
MSKKKILTTSAVLILILLGFVLGYWLNSQKKLEESAVEKSTIAKLESSKLVQSWIVTIYGKITEISGRDLTLTQQGETLAVSIKDNAKISSANFAQGISTSSGVEDIEFDEVSIGDNVSIAVEVKKDGKLEGINLTVVKIAN